MLIEKSPHFRDGGYLIDFWGVGYTIAERMGILPEVRRAGYSYRELRLIDDEGRKVGGFSTGVFERKTHGRFTTIPRGDLARAIYETIEDRIETLFGTEISEIEQGDGVVRVGFTNGATQEFDLVIGADGLHSGVRRLAFGAQERFEKTLGYRVATFEVEGYRPRDELVYVGHASPGRQFARIALRNDRTMFLFVFRAELMTRPEPANLPERLTLLQEIFSNVGLESAPIHKAIKSVRDLYYDRVSQIKLPAWSTGRVALVGDAAAAVSLLAGEGTGLAMAAGYVLAGELMRARSDHLTAFRNYERRMRPFVEAKQRSAEKFAASFLPRTPLGIWARNQATKVMRVPRLADLLIGRMVSDDLTLPTYELGKQ